MNQAIEGLKQVGGRKYKHIKKAPHEVLQWGSRAENVPKQTNLNQ